MFCRNKTVICIQIVIREYNKNITYNFLPTVVGHNIVSQSVRRLVTNVIEVDTRHVQLPCKFDQQLIDVNVDLPLKSHSIT